MSKLSTAPSTMASVYDPHYEGPSNEPELLPPASLDGRTGSRTPTGIPLADAQLLLNNFPVPEAYRPRSPPPFREWMADDDMLGAAAVLFSTRLLDFQKRQQLGGSGSPIHSAHYHAAVNHGGASLSTTSGAHIPATAAEETAYQSDDNISTVSDVRENEDSDEDEGEVETTGGTTTPIPYYPPASATSPGIGSVHHADAQSNSSGSSSADEDDGEESSDSSESSEDEAPQVNDDDDGGDISGAVTPTTPAPKVLPPVISVHPGFQDLGSLTEYFPERIVDPTPTVRPFRMSRLKRSRYESSDDETSQQLHDPRRRKPIATPRKMKNATLPTPPGKRQKQEAGSSPGRATKPRTPPPRTSSSPSGQSTEKTAYPSSSSHTPRKRDRSPSPSPQSSVSPTDDATASPTPSQAHQQPSTKRRKSTKTATNNSAGSPPRKCGYCTATQTPMWRHGPKGYTDLCNKCGVKWMRGRILQNTEE
ncbi:hypothetical protein DFJ77DRAFT_194186 [Powellomyces hirtus]|nr:hypothetical protein DFJ77DRAFT_194186 [Powellomyces hirtus]